MILRRMNFQSNLRTSRAWTNCLCLTLLLFFLFSAISLTPVQAENEGSNIPISVENGGAVPPVLLGDDQQNPAIIDLPDKHLWFVVWEDWRNGSTSGADIYGRFINADGTLCGDEIAISTAAGNQIVPTVAYRDSNSGSDNIMIAWQDSRGTGYSGYIYYRFCDVTDLTSNCSSGAVLGKEKIVSYQSIMGDRLKSRKQPQIAYDRSRDWFWMVWSESRDQVQRSIEYPLAEGFDYYYWSPTWYFADSNYVAYTTVSAASSYVGETDILRNKNGRTDRTIRMISSSSESTDDSIEFKYIYEYFTDINNVKVACDDSSPEVLIAWEGVRGEATLTCEWEEKDEETIEECHYEYEYDDEGTLIKTEVCEDVPNPDYGQPTEKDKYTSKLELDGSADDGKIHIYSIFDKYINQAVVHSRKLDAADVPAYHPALGFDSAHSKFLAAWESTNDGDGIHSSISGQLIYSGGGLYGSNFLISHQDLDGDGELDEDVKTTNQTRPNIASDSSNQRFFVSWQDGRNSATSFIENVDIYGQFVDSVGSLQGSNYAVCIAEGNQYSPATAFNQFSYQFLSVWKDARNSDTTNSDIYAERFSSGQSQFIVLDADGALLSPPLYDFSSVKMGQFATASIILKNAGDSTIVLDAVTPLVKPFYYLGLPAELVSVGDGSEMSLLPGSSFTLSIQFIPNSMGVFFDKFSTVSNATDITVNLQGQGVGTDVYVTPTILNFPDCEIGSSITLPVVVINSSENDVQIKTVFTRTDVYSVRGIDDGDIIKADGVLTCQVTFKPTAAGIIEDVLNIDIEDTRYFVQLRGTVNSDFDYTDIDSFTADRDYRLSISASTDQGGQLYVIFSHNPLSVGKIYALAKDGTLQPFPYLQSSGWQNLWHLESAHPGLGLDLSTVDFRPLGCSACQGEKIDDGGNDFDFGNIVITPPDDTVFNNATDFKYMPGTLYMGTYVKDASSSSGAFDFNKGMLEIQSFNIHPLAGTWKVTSRYYDVNQVHPTNLVVTENGDGAISAVWPGYNVTMIYGTDASGYVMTFSMGKYNYVYKITSLTNDSFTAEYSCTANGEVLDSQPACGVRRGSVKDQDGWLCPEMKIVQGDPDNPDDGIIASFSGDTNKTTSTFTIDEPVDFQWQHSGDGNFIVHLYKSDGSSSDLIVNYIGAGSNSTRYYDSGTYYLDVTANGDWTINVVPVE